VKSTLVGTTLGILAVAGCAAPRAPLDEDLRNAASTLDVVRRAGYPIEIEAVKTSSAFEQRIEVLRAVRDPRASVFLFSRNHTGFVLTAALARVLGPTGQAAPLRWVKPFLEAGDLRGAPRAFAHGLLLELWRRGRVERHEPFVPMLPPEIGAKTPSRTLRLGLPLAFFVALVGIARRIPWRRRSSGTP